MRSSLTFPQESLTRSRLLRTQDPSKGLSDYSSLEHLTGKEEWLLNGHPDSADVFHNRAHSFRDVPLSTYRIAIRFGLPAEVALLFRDIAYIHDWDPDRTPGTGPRAIITVDLLDENRTKFQTLGWRELHFLIAKAFVLRTEYPFTDKLEGLEKNPGYDIYREKRTTPFNEYYRTIHALIGLIHDHQATPEDVALVLKWAPMFAEYADHMNGYTNCAFEQTVRNAESRVNELNNEARSAGQDSSMRLDRLDVPAYLNSIGTQQSFELDEKLIRQLRENPLLKLAIADLHIPRLNKALHTAGRASWRKFIRNQTLWNFLQLELLRGLKTAGGMDSLKTGYDGYPKSEESPFFHAAQLSRKLSASEATGLLFNPYSGGSTSNKKKREYRRPRNGTLKLLVDFVKAQMKSRYSEISFGEDPPEALAYQFNQRKPVQDPAAALAEMLINPPLDWYPLLKDLVEWITPNILLEAVEQCFVHPKNDTWDERERNQIFGRTAQLLGRVALASPENGMRVSELLSKLHYAVPDETILSSQKRKIVQEHVKVALIHIKLHENLSEGRLVDILTEHWMDEPARIKALKEAAVDDDRVTSLARIGMDGTFRRVTRRLHEGPAQLN
jgi:hypothetical protein